jgi:hypothetical protein
MAAQLFYWTSQLVDSVAGKQSSALHRAANGDSNVYGLSIDEVRQVCESQRPWEYQGQVTFQSAEHQRHWEKMNAMPLDKIVEEFEESIQNRRILKEVLG